MPRTSCRKPLSKPSKRGTKSAEKLLGWLLTIAENLTRNEIRNAERRRRAGDSPLESLDSLPPSGREAPYVSFLADTDARQAEMAQKLKAKLLRLLQGKDRKVAKLKFEGAEIEEIAATVGPTAEAVQKRWERIYIWLKSIAPNLDALVNCLPEERDRWIMERYLDGQPLSEITEALGIFPTILEKTVKRVIAQWKKAAKENPTDPISAMVKKEG